MQYKIFKIGLGVFTLCFIAFFIMGMTPKAGKSFDFKCRGLCSKVGTFHGEAPDMGITWMVVNSPGMNPANGQFMVEWTEIDPTLGIPMSPFTDAVHVTNASGVWKKVGRNMYEFTWIAYGLDQDGFLAYSARASGTAKLTDCDHVDMNYVLELWPAGYDIYSDPPVVTTPGTGVETRMPLVQASCSD